MIAFLYPDGGVQGGIGIQGPMQMAGRKPEADLIRGSGLVDKAKITVVKGHRGPRAKGLRAPASGKAS